ncbi:MULTISPECIES: DNA polymerase Y family protein [unclassified Curtobacterium]|uniref:DNA polymerase Y family protein n=1 Tax=unclassified Curtobacterium TaxID=257496 RepID=UPI00203E74F2|nr:MULTISPECIES: DNA polymerase Y family protein [unclassified Curtobacterium]MCM3504765.1 DNA polymerase Y family protein [Curtobacterium sp. ODYSSEY 48 V2]MCM3520677.1 DNA polymerase Y family protein [Curtobacterium sp. P97]
MRADALARGGALPEPPPARTIVLWCPDWPVIAAARAAGSPPEHPFALVAKGVVFASSASARQQGVVRGLRVREAQARCPELVVEPYDDALDHRAFEPVIRAIEEAVPGVEVLRPGTIALRSRGPARYYGGERAAAATLAGIAADHGAPGVRAGVADTPFAAEQAARSRPVRPGERVRIVPVGGSAPFLADLPLGVLGDPDLAMVLGRLGIATLGDFAALGDEQVRDRFGVAGAFLHRLAGGRDPREVAARAVPPELRVEASFEPPLDRADQVAFAFRRSADDFAARLRAAGLVATTIRVGIVDERDLLLERTWVHPRWFDAADVVDRVRWQLAGGVDPSGLEAPVVQVVLEPVAVDDASNHERGLWGTGPDERVHHALARVQGLVGHEGVVTPRIGGGRTLAERVVLVPWGDAPVGGERALATVRDRPWPGRLPGPPPATVLERPRPVDVVAAGGDTVDVDDRGALTAVPERFRAEGERGGRFASVTAWAGPWPLVVRWWEAGGRRLHRLQVVDDDGRAWYLVLADHRWWAEAVAT